MLPYEHSGASVLNHRWTHVDRNIRSQAYGPFAMSEIVARKTYTPSS